MIDDDAPYFRQNLAFVHHRGFDFHADMCALGVLTLLEDVRERDGLVVETGCGSGVLTRYLVGAGAARHARCACGGPTLLRAITG